MTLKGKYTRTQSRCCTKNIFEPDAPRGRPPKLPLPYKLVSTPSQLKNLVLGRRKAIEVSTAGYLPL